MILQGNCNDTMNTNRQYSMVGIFLRKIRNQMENIIYRRIYFKKGG